MTSKEALEICKELYAERNTSLKSAKKSRDKCDEDMKHIWNDDIDYFQSQVDFYERIIQDLEVLEILKSHAKLTELNSVYMGYPKTIVIAIEPNDDDYEIVKRWLDNDK